MNVASAMYARLIRSEGMVRVFWHLVRKALIKLAGDPPVKFRIHGRWMQMPLSHGLPTYLGKYPYYDSLPQRISSFVHERRGLVRCIDVGANVGDTVAAFCDGHDTGDSRFLAIEPNPRFARYLAENWGSDSRVVSLNVLCTSCSTGRRSFSINERRGTASIVEEKGGNGMQTASIDDIVFSDPGFGDVNILKIDTDGHDFEVLAGARETVRSLRPVVLFECDVFSNTRYVADCLDALSHFQEAGYTSFLVYDNLGYLVGRHSLDNTGSFEDLLFYQVTSPFCYYDILLMPGEEIEAFHARERQFFLDNVADKLPKGNSAVEACQAV